MGRRIKEDDTYYNSLLKLIPSEIVAVYIAIQAFLIDVDFLVSAVVTLIFLVATPLWLYRFTNIREKGLNDQEILQLAVSTVSMLVWIFALGGPFIHFDLYNDNATYLVPLVMILWTGLIAPLVLGKKPSTQI
jgi:hypothetical protein